MNHDAAIAGEFPRRYLAQALSDAETEAFEDHLVDCTICQHEIAADELMRAGFRAAEVRSLPVRASPAWLRTYAIAASVLLAVSVGWGAWLQTGRTPPLDEDGVRATGTTTVRLAITRAGTDAPDAVLTHVAGASGWLLDVDVPMKCSDGAIAPVCADGARPSTPAEDAYNLTIRAASTEAVVYEVRDQHPLAAGVVVFHVPHAALPPGEYRVEVMGRQPAARFRVAVAP